MHSPQQNQWVTGCRQRFTVEDPYDIVSGGYPALFTKSEDWSYEAEWRLIAEERRFARSFWTLKTNNDFLTLAPGVLTSVTIGCLADEPSRQRIEDIVFSNAPGVLVRQATLAPDRYELRINPPFRYSCTSRTFAPLTADASDLLKCLQH